jgi:hypothetical protein
VGSHTRGERLDGGADRAGRHEDVQCLPGVQGQVRHGSGL